VEDLDGVVLSYSDVELVEAGGLIHFERPQIHFRVLARFLIFKPTSGAHFIGVVNKVGIAHIGLLLFGAFNVSIPARAIRGEYAYDALQESWVNSDNPEHAIAIGSPVRFQLVSGSNSGEFYSIVGSLRKQSCGPVSEVGDALPLDDCELHELDDATTAPAFVLPPAFESPMKGRSAAARAVATVTAGTQTPKAGAAAGAKTPKAGAKASSSSSSSSASSEVSASTKKRKSEAVTGESAAAATPKAKTPKAK
jgi:DNA-directed RNA polymerase subunit E'/Rpb7